MKKPIKYALYIVTVLLATLALVYLLANYVFTTNLSLSCTGKEVLTVYMGVKGTPIETKEKLEGVKITATKYPFKDHHLIITSEHVHIISGTEGEMTSVLDTQIIGAKRSTTKDADIYKSISFNRLTRGIEIESIFKNLNDS